MMAQVFVNRTIDCLNDCEAAEAIRLLKEHKITGDSLNQIISVIISNLTSSVLQHKKAVFECYSDVLMFIAENSEPMEIILKFLKHLNCASDHVNFCAILDSLHLCIIRIQKKIRVIDWCLNSIKRYIKTLPLPDEDPEVNNALIICTYKAIVVFLEPLVQEAIDINSKQEEGSLFGDYLLSFFISLFGKPFCCVNIEYIPDKKEYKELANNMVTQALCLTGDILYFLDIVSKRQRKLIYFKKKFICFKRKLFEDFHFCLRSSLFEETNHISNIAYANFYFYIITKEDHWQNVPQMYNSYYILETCAYFFKILLSEENLISIGLIFMENVMKRISPHSVDSEVLGLEIYTELFQPIINVMLYSNSDEQRKKAVHVFEEYIELFNMEARYTVILYLYEIIQHSGLLSFVIGLFKSSIIQCLDSTPRNPQFLGRNMELLLKRICDLPHGSSSDVVEISDEIITALNLLRFLFLRDKNNESGIWNMTDMLKNDYLNPLREGIDLCKAHWRVKIKDLEKQKKNLAKEKDYNKLLKAHTEVTLTVGGEQLPVMPLTQKISICYQAINGLDVMESILIRVNECIEMNEKFVEKSDECTT